MSKLKSIFYKILYSIPFGLKGADTEIMGSRTTNGNAQSLQQEVGDERVGKHLLKGEITQSVKELRHRTYKVDKESKNYEYIGGGNVIKKSTSNVDRHNIRFSQECKLIASDVLEELKRVGTYGKENYTLQISYNNPLVKFKLEQFANKIDVDIKDNCELIQTTLHFSSIPDGYEKKSAPFINELKRLLNVAQNMSLVDDENMIAEVYKHNEIASSMVTLSFTTFKATNDEPDLIVYNFMSPHFSRIEEDNAEIRLTFVWDKYDSNDLTIKFFEPKMDMKYDTHEKKRNYVNILSNQERIAHCDVCGKEMNIYDADVTKFTYGKSLCKDCLMKKIIDESELVSQ